MSIEFDVSGFEGLEAALLALPRSTSRGVVRRALKKELDPVASMANAFWPGASDDVFKVTSRIRRSQRSQSSADFSRTVVNLFVGASRTPEAHLLEFGTAPRRQISTGRYTGQVAPIPMLQPAWDVNKPKMIRGLSRSIWEEIMKTQARRAARNGRAPSIRT